MAVGRRRALLPISLGLLLCACASGPQSNPDTTASTASTMAEIVEARDYLETVRALGNEWRISHPLTGGRPMSLGEMLVLSEKAESQGDSNQARQIALLVSAYSQLAVSQSRNNRYVTPRYLQN